MEIGKKHNIGKGMDSVSNVPRSARQEGVRSKNSKFTHLDLFSGIGGFALATQWAFGDKYENVGFCDIDPYCQKLLELRFPDSEIYGDIKKLTYEQICKDYALIAKNQKNQGDVPIANHATQNVSLNGGKIILKDEKTIKSSVITATTQNLTTKYVPIKIDLITGGFPCQPFSVAGKQRGTDDNRFLWPEMFRVIQDCKPTWVIAENVRGILNIEGGMVFERVCSELESIGYEVQSFIIPACAVNAPHRRDRVWIVGYSEHNGKLAAEKREGNKKGGRGHKKGAVEICQPTRSDSPRGNVTDASKQGGECGKSKKQGEYPQCEKGILGRDDSGDDINANDKRLQRGSESEKNSRKIKGGKKSKHGGIRQFRGLSNIGQWNQNWLEVATELCGMDDGLSAELDGLKLSKSGHRTQRLKALGNAIVPQIAFEFFKIIAKIESDEM